MREKTLKIVITFHTTSEAMACEKALHEGGIPGRLIPIPTSISAGCGLAWCMLPSEKEGVMNYMEEKKLLFEGIYECKLL